MKHFEIVEVDEDIKQNILNDFPEEGKLLSVRPPGDKTTIHEMERLFTTLHTLKMESSFLGGVENNSDTCGLEIWYDKEQFEFVFYVPNKEQERHYRKQLVGHFDEIGIQKKVDNSFLPIEEGDYIAGGRFHLNHHYFEPVNHNDFTHSDAYKPILSEMDSRDDTRAMMQILYKPARSNWTKTSFNSVSEYADTIEDGYKWGSKFGIPVKQGYSEKYKEVAKDIRDQEDSLAYHVNIRLMFVSSSDDSKLEQQARNVEHQIAREYRRQNGQTFDIQPAQSKDEMLELIDLMSNRKEHTMDRATGLSVYLRTLLKKLPIIGRFISEIYKTRMIMTIPELAAVCHLSNPDMLETIVGSDDVYQSANIPEKATRHEEMTKEERIQANRGDNNEDN